MILIVVFVVSLLAVEVIYHLCKQKGVGVALASSVAVTAIAGGYGYLFETSRYGVPVEPYKYALFYIVVSGLPLVAASFISRLLTELSAGQIHFFSFLFAVVNTTLFPLLAIYTGCYLNIDCL